MTEYLQTLVARARKVTMSHSELREHRKSFVYGNTFIENSDVTREMVDDADRNFEEQKTQK